MNIIRNKFSSYTLLKLGCNDSHGASFSCSCIRLFSSRDLLLALTYGRLRSDHMTHEKSHKTSCVFRACKRNS